MKTTVLISFLLLAPTMAADDWPYFLGPNADNISKETGLLNVFPKDGPREVFAKRIGTGYSPVSVRDGKVVVFHRVSKLLKVSEADTILGILKYINGELEALKVKQRVTLDGLKKAQSENQRRGYIRNFTENSKFS